MGFIFFVFAPVSILLISPFKHDRSFLCLVTYALMGGFTAAGYAFSFIRDLRALFLVVPAQALWFIMPRWFPNDFRAGFTPSLEGALLVGMIVTGYVLFIIFFQREGVRTIRMHTELALAKQIHASLIPPITGRHGPLELYGHSLAGAEMGGDLIDVMSQNGTTDVLIADVSGHGVKAGVIMAVVKAAFHTRLRGQCDLEALFGDVNAVICDLAREGMFVTASALRFDPSGKAHFCGAGHGPILHYRLDRDDLALLEADSPPLGVLNQERFAAQRVTYRSGDVFLFMTDGLTEVFSSGNAMLGSKAIELRFLELARHPLSEIYEAIMEIVRAHGPQSDDQTLLLARVL